MSGFFFLLLLKKKNKDAAKMPLLLLIKFFFILCTVNAFIHFADKPFADSTTRDSDIGHQSTHFVHCENKLLLHHENRMDKRGYLHTYTEDFTKLREENNPFQDCAELNA